ncbi:MAG: class I SAM-dependent methyltransferase [Actinomycetia bacterium]|nr:class I SAM-dependent methyltransferase [Actinomycetes bacterium]
MDSMHKLMLSEARIRKPKATSILEVGCGRGAFLFAVADFFPQAQLTGIDISSKAIAAARQNRFPGFSNTSIAWHLASVDKMMFADGTYDIVFAGKTMHHWEDKQAGLSEISRVLKDNGILILGDPFTDGPLKYPWFNSLNETLDGGTFTSLAELKQMLVQANLHLIEKIFVPRTMRTLSVCVIGKNKKG